MAFDTLVNIIKEHWSDPAVTSVPFPIGDAELIEMVKRARIVDYTDAINFLHEKDVQSGEVTVTRSNGLAEFTMIDLDGGARYFGFRRRYFMWPDPPSIYINDIVIDPSITYTWNPYSFALDLDAAITVGAVVTVKGHLVNFQLLLADVGDLLATKYEQMADVKGPEFSELARRTRRRVNRMSARILTKPVLT